MYRTVIIDDEEWTVKGLLKSVNWAEEGFDLLYAGTDPSEALKYILEERPDFVLTDIKMPGLTGLDLVRTTRETGIDCEFIILTGFAEFEFSQQAIRYGVTDYLLKPYEPEELRRSLTEMKEKLREKQLYQNLKDSRMLYSHPEAFARRIEERGLLARRRYLQAVTCDRCVGDLLPDIAAEDQLCLWLNDATVTFFVGVDYDLFYSGLLDDCEGCWGTSEVRDGAQEVKTLAEQSFAARYTTLFSQKRHFSYHAYSIPEANQAAGRIIYAMEKDHSPERLERLLTDELTNLSSLEALVYLYNWFSLYQRVKEPESSGNLSHIDLYDFVARFDTLDDVIDSVVELLAPVIPATAGETLPVTNQSFQRLIQYVNENYSKHLNLKDLCAQFYINMNYCCALFKRNLGSTFSEYLLKLRIQKASELILTTTLPIQQIAELTGYNDYYYFQRVFKKYYGVTPFRYRNGKGEEG